MTRLFGAPKVRFDREVFALPLRVPAARVGDWAVLVSLVLLPLGLLPVIRTGSFSNLFNPPHHVIEMMAFMFGYVSLLTGLSLRAAAVKQVIVNRKARTLTVNGKTYEANRVVQILNTERYDPTDRTGYTKRTVTAAIGRFVTPAEGYPPVPRVEDKVELCTAGWVDRKWAREIAIRLAIMFAVPLDDRGKEVDPHKAAGQPPHKA